MLYLYKNAQHLKCIILTLHIITNAYLSNNTINVLVLHKCTAIFGTVLKVQNVNGFHPTKHNIDFVFHLLSMRDDSKNNAFISQL